ncbi:MAG: lamin tail domain-containing protein [Bacteroidia bacterium]|nr:lamin tail domain-containing protein [Bacteroidia bacterium]MDW8134477.1 lamin tail domain-containing protein [Bacteroidia bacterium]
MQFRRIGLLTTLLWAQIQEDFSDGDFSNNPIWSGTDAYWSVTSDYRLRSNGPSATSTIYLSTPNTLIQNTEWRFWVRVAFNPSSQNFARVYLVSDRSDLTDPNLNGYYLRLGGITGNLDSLEFWRQQGGTHTRLAGGRPGRFGGTNNILRVRVIRDAAGVWQVFTDTLGFWEPEFSLTDNVISTTSHFGIYFQHTSSNRQNLWLDDIYVGPPIQDNTPPQALSAEVVTPTQVRITFSEAVENTSATNINAYTISPGAIPIVSATRPLPNTVELTLGQPLQPSVSYTLTYTGIQDMAGNVGSGSVPLILVELPAPGDLIFSEVMAKPTPVVGLPPYEYVEIYNRSTKWIKLDGVRLCDASQCATIGAGILAPGGFALLIPNSAASDYPDGIALSNWPTLNDSGDSLTLWNSNSDRLDFLPYKSSWYRNSAKAQGGWSLERIDPDNLCALDSNWIASVAAAGGTPRAPNSVLGMWRDTIPPRLLRVDFISNTELVLVFSEPVDVAFMQSPTRYQITGGPSVSAVQISGEQVYLTLSAPLAPSTDYTISVEAADCMGNQSLSQYVFGLPEPAAPHDVIINEIMADPDPAVGLPPFEYIEIYNRSQKYIALEGWTLKIGSSQRTLPPYLLRPGEYVTLSSVEAALALAPYGATIGFSSFPAVSNNGSTITLRDANGNIIDLVKYDITWYKDEQKEEGGWSLERIWADWLCGGSEGWRASIAPLGGTPSQPNSVRQSTSPPPPRIQEVLYVPPIVQVRFSERMDTTVLYDPQIYSWDPPISLIAATPIEGGFGVELLPMTPLEESRIYRLNIIGLRNCANEALSTLSTEVIVPSPITPGDVIVSEILPEPQTSGSRYVELYNRSTRILDISELTLAKGAIPNSLKEVASKPVYIFPNSYICLTADTTDVKERYLPPPTARFHEMKSFPTYDYTEDTVWVLRKRDLVVIERVPYKSSYHFPDLRSRKGVALERLSFDQPAEEPQNWYSAASTVRYGTPGYANSQREIAGEAGQIRVEPKTFSPDGDGYEDLLWIHVPVAEAGVKATISVHTLSGHQIKMIEENTLLGTSENQFRWEGTDESGKRMPPGVYIIQVRLTSPSRGKTSTYRLPCAIAERLK